MTLIFTFCRVLAGGVTIFELVCGFISDAKSATELFGIMAGRYVRS